MTKKPNTKAYSPPRKLDLKETERILRGALTKEPPPTLVEVAKNMGRRHCTLTYQFPGLCDSIVERYAAYRKHCRSERVESARQVLEAALKDDSHPSPADIAKRIGWSPQTLIKLLPQLCSKLSEWHVEGRKKKWLNVGRTLEAILKEWPPLPMSQITKRTGYCGTSLNRHHRVLCRRLAVRSLEYCKTKNRPRKASSV